jgi:ankyrin repeat protein
MLNQGADVNKFDPLGRTPLMYAAASDALPLDVVKLLIERGADVNAKSRHKLSGDAGLSVLDIAKLHGETPIVEWLVKSGAKGTQPVEAPLRPVRENTLRDAIERSLPLLQRADASFSAKGDVSHATTTACKLWRWPPPGKPAFDWTRRSQHSR